jgi:hypothetical protein
MDFPGGLYQLIVERRQCKRPAECFLPDQRTSQVGGVIAPQVMFNCQGVATHHGVLGDRQAMVALPFRAELAQVLAQACLQIPYSYP